MDLDLANGWNSSKQMFALHPQQFQQTRNSAKEWNLDPVLRQLTTLGKIVTQDLDSNTKVRHGQITPPSDAKPTSEAAVQIQKPQNNSAVLSKGKAGGRRRKSTQTIQPADSSIHDDERVQLLQNLLLRMRRNMTRKWTRNRNSWRETESPPANIDRRRRNGRTILNVVHENYRHTRRG
jgi:hypothetical protein